MIKLDIHSFLKTGILGKTKVGVNKNDLIEQFGTFDESQKYFHHQEESNGGVSIFIDGVEYLFIKDMLDMISLDPNRVELTLGEEFYISSEITLDGLIFILEKNNILRKIYQKHTFGKQVLIELESGVRISFMFQEKKGFLLDKIQKYFGL